jgi:hypothetical protein
MPSFRATVTSDLSPDEAFAYMARFSNAAEWDPGVIAAEEEPPGPPALGSHYRLRIGFLGRQLPLDYRITEIEEPRRVVLQAENSMVRSTDTIEVSPCPGGGSSVRYDADLAPKGPYIVLAPLLGVAFRRIGARAVAGLQEALGS